VNLDIKFVATCVDLRFWKGAWNVDLDIKFVATCVDLRFGTGLGMCIWT